MPHRLKNVEEKVRGLDAGNVAGALGNVFVCCVELQKSTQLVNIYAAPAYVCRIHVLGIFKQHILSHG